MEPIPMHRAPTPPVPAHDSNDRRSKVGTMKERIQLMWQRTSTNVRAHKEAPPESKIAMAAATADGSCRTVPGDDSDKGRVDSEMDPPVPAHARSETQSLRHKPSMASSRPTTPKAKPDATHHKWQEMKKHIAGWTKGTRKNTKKGSAPAHEEPNGPQVKKDNAPISEASWERYQQARFKGIAEISDDALIALACQYLAAAEHSLDASDTAIDAVDVFRNKNGSNNRVFVVTFTKSGKGKQNLVKICIRVPACGTREQWTKKDAEVLRDYALAMKMIKENTACPVPEVYGFDTTLDNVIGAPYTAIAFAEGETAFVVWYQRGSLQEQKRQTILKTLAQAVSELRAFEYTQMGALKFGNDEKTTYIGDFYLANFGTTERDSKFFQQQENLYVYEPARCSRAKLKAALDHWRVDKLAFLEERDASLEEYYMCWGIFAYYSDIVKLMPAAKDKKTDTETFGLVPPDFGLQNILVDSDGQVTALIDWDRVGSEPRFAGWERVPDFLIKDFDSHYRWPHPVPNVLQMSPFELNHYRACYGHYMAEVCGTDEGVGNFTTKSALCNAVYNSIGDDTEQTILLEKILAQICPRVDVRDHLIEVGRRNDRDILRKLGMRAELSKLLSDKQSTKRRTGETKQEQATTQGHSARTQSL